MKLFNETMSCLAPLTVPPSLFPRLPVVLVYCVCLVPSQDGHILSINKIIACLTPCINKTI